MIRFHFRFKQSFTYQPVMAYIEDSLLTPMHLSINELHRCMDVPIQLIWF